MIRIRKAAGATLSVAALVVSTAVAATAQSTSQPSGATPSDPGGNQVERGEKGATPRKEAAQEQFDREKVTLKDHVSQQVSAADANIDALKKLSDTDKGPTKQRDKDLENKLSDLRDNLKKDLDKIDKAKPNDWSGVRPVVDRDMNAMEAQLRTAEPITKVPAPRTGAASKQPGGSPTSTPEPSPGPSDHR